MAALAGTSGTIDKPKQRQQQQAPSHNDTFNGSKKLPPRMSLFLLLLLVLSTLIPLTAADTVTFSATGATQTFTVPTGVTLITFDLRGARGGFVGTNSAGYGARVVTDITVVPGEVLNINVGAAGVCLTTAQGMVFGGGGPSAIADAAGSYGGTGGGATDVRRGGTGVGNRIAVAGGGGGIYKCSATNIAGGHGGQVGSMGNKCFGSTTVSAGTGGTQSAGGTGGYYTSVCLSPVPAGAGTQTSGGAATSCKGDGGGGGGGGYWGGGGGANGGSGGGGSSYSSSGPVTATRTRAPTRKPSVSASSASAPPSVATTDSASIVEGGNKKDSDIAWVIGGSVVGGLLAIWLGFRLWKWSIYALEQHEKKKAMMKMLQTVNVIADSIQERTVRETTRRRTARIATGAGVASSGGSTLSAIAEGVPRRTHPDYEECEIKNPNIRANATRLHKDRFTAHPPLNSEASSQSSSSLGLSSLHSSERSEGSTVMKQDCSVSSNSSDSFSSSESCSISITSSWGSNSSNAYSFPSSVSDGADSY
eukprot:gene7629-9133_t